MWNSLASDGERAETEKSDDGEKLEKHVKFPCRPDI